jgi:hypothetical protein
MFQPKLEAITRPFKICTEETVITVYFLSIYTYFKLACPDQPWTHQASYTVGTGFPFPGAKWLGRGINHPPLSSADIEETVELYFYSPSLSLWQGYRVNFNLYPLVGLHLQLALQPLVGFGLLYDFVPQSSIFTLLSPVSHFHLL